MQRGAKKEGAGGTTGSPTVILYHAEGCHLCERARSQLHALRAQRDFELHEVDITGVPGLEARYRELIPVVEIGGEQAFTYYIHEAAFLRRLDAQAHV